MALKPMLPALREKKRYLVFEVESEDEVSQKDCVKAVNEALHRFLGELGMARAGVIFLPDWESSCGILRVSHKEVDNVKAALALVAEVKGRAKVRTLYVSGILGKARKMLEERRK